MKSNVYLKIAISTLVLFIVGLLPLFTTEILFDKSFLFWKLISDLLIVILALYFIENTSLHGFKLIVTIFTLFFVIGHFNILIEAYIFNVTDRKETVLQIVYGFVINLIMAPIFVRIFEKKDKKNALPLYEKRSVIKWIWKVFVGIFLYIFFYLLAGFILQMVYPELLDFYEGKIPSFDIMIGTQVFRGLIFVLIAILILRTLIIKPWKKAIYIGIFFAFVGGVLPLIIPNELMPYSIRMAHLIEVLSSNFIYGVLLAYLLLQKRVVLNADN